MITALSLVLALAAPMQDTALVVGPVYRNAVLGIELPRPFDDWVFAPATERGTTTVIFHPRSAPLSDHLWGALVLTPWDAPPELQSLADRRMQDTWRRTFGSSFTLRSRDSVEVAGAPAIRLRMGGSIQRAVVDVEEYLIARGHDLIVLQFRYPRGVPSDSIAVGYARSLAGLRLRTGESVQVSPQPPAPFAPRLDGGQVVFEVPAGMRAVSAGSLTAELVTGALRMMRYRPLVEDAPLLYAVGRFHLDERRIGRLGFRIWRNTDAAVGVTTVNDAALQTLARGWSRFWLAFGPVPIAELTVVETDWPASRGAPGIVFVGTDANDAVLLRELSRTWWGGFARSSGLFAPLVNEILPAWAPRVAGASAGESDPAVLALERMRNLVDGGRFREALRTLAANARREGAVPGFFAALGAPGAALRLTLFP